jgi:hypothetical protein
VAKKKKSPRSNPKPAKSKSDKTSNSKQSSSDKHPSRRGKTTADTIQTDQTRLVAKTSSDPIKGANGSAVDEESTAASYQLLMQVNWEDPTTHQSINNMRIDVFDDADKGAYSTTKSVIIALLPKIVAKNGGLGWKYKQTNGKITS